MSTAYVSRPRPWNYFQSVNNNTRKHVPSAVSMDGSTQSFDLSLGDNLDFIHDINEEDHETGKYSK